MPTMVADTQDRFAEVFGTKRGVERPEEDFPVAPADTDGSVVACAGECGTSVEASPSNALGPGMPFHYCPTCLPTARLFLSRAQEANKRKGTAETTVNTEAKKAASEPQRAERTRRKKARRAARWRIRKCYFSRPFGHVMVPMENPPVMVRGRAYVCAGCGKFQGKDG